MTSCKIIAERYWIMKTAKLNDLYIFLNVLTSKQKSKICCVVEEVMVFFPHRK